jgi:hypothetical protein
MIIAPKLLCIQNVPVIYIFYIYNKSKYNTVYCSLFLQPTAQQHKDTTKHEVNLQMNTR